MRELTLLGLNVENGQLQLTDDQDNHYVLDITEDLRSAVRRSALATSAGSAGDQAPFSPGAEAGGAEGEEPVQPLRPREIQELVRAGMTVDEIMAEYDEADRDRLEKFASAVISERRYTVQRTLEIHQSREPGAPTFGEVVIDRLATRDVSEEDISWDAIRRGAEPWEVSVTFRVDDCEKRAAWCVDFSANSIRPIDDEARWLTEAKTSARNRPEGLLGPALRGSDRHSVTDYPAAGLRPDPTDSLVPRRTPNSSRTTQSAGSANSLAGASSAPTPASSSAGTDTLLEHLSATRGSRSAYVPGIDEHTSGAESATSPTSPEAASAHSAGLTSVGSARSASSAGRADDGANPETADSPARGGARIFSLPERRRRNKERAEKSHISSFPSPDSPDSAGSSENAATSVSGESAESASDLTARSARSPLAGAPSPSEEGALLSRSDSGATQPEPKPAKKTTRQSIPSWDEIVFGTKKDD